MTLNTARGFTPNTPRSHHLRRAVTGLVTIAISISLAGCKEKKTEESKKVIPTVGSGADTGAPARLSAHADKLGFLPHIPADTQLFIGTLNVKKHLSLLSTSSFYGEVSAFLDDKTPAPTADNKPSTQRLMAPMLSDSAFLAVGRGGAEAVAVINHLATLNSRSFYSQMAGLLTPGEPKEEPKTKKTAPAKEKVAPGADIAAMIQQLEVPDIMVGLRGEDPAAALQTLVPEAQAKWWGTLGKGAEVTLADKSHFILHEGKLGTLITTYEKQVQERPDGEVKQLILSSLEALKQKTITVAWGTKGDQALLVIGSKRPTFQFPSKPEDSLLMKPEWDALVPHAAKSLIAIGWMDAAVLEAAHNDAWLAPILSAVLANAGPKSPLAGLGKGLENQLAALAESERRFLASSHTNAVFAAWWNQGLHAELHGGIAEDDLAAPQSLQYASLLSEPDLLFGHVGSSTSAAEARLNEYLENCGVLIRDAAWAILDRGKSSASPVASIRPWLEQEVLPPLVQLYQSSRKMTQAALGDERALLVTVESPAPSASQANAPKTPSPIPIPRIARVAPVTDRRAVGTVWLNMEPALADLTKAFPMLQAAQLADETSTVHAGLDIYSLPLPLPWPEVSPCLGLSDSVMVVSSSQDLCKSIASNLPKDLQATDKQVSTWRLNVPLLRKILGRDLPPDVGVEDLGGYLHWLTPLGEVKGTTTVVNGRVKRAWSWDIRDPARFD